MRLTYTIKQVLENNGATIKDFPVLFNAYLKGKLKHSDFKHIYEFFQREENNLIKFQDKILEDIFAEIVLDPKNSNLVKRFSLLKENLKDAPIEVKESYNELVLYSIWDSTERSQYRDLWNEFKDSIAPLKKILSKKSTYTAVYIEVDDDGKESIHSEDVTGRTKASAKSSIKKDNIKKVKLFKENDTTGISKYKEELEKELSKDKK